MDTATTSHIQTTKDIELQKAWEALWEFANNEISWTEHRIDRDSFIEIGKELFDVKSKG